MVWFKVIGQKKLSKDITLWKNPNIVESGRIKDNFIKIIIYLKSCKDMNQALIYLKVCGLTFDCDLLLHAKGKNNLQEYNSSWCKQSSYEKKMKRYG